MTSGGLHQLHAVAGRGEADALGERRQQGQAEAQGDSLGSPASLDGGADVGQQTDDDAEQDHRTEGDLVGRHRLRIPQPGHDSGDRSRDGLLDQRGERGAESGQGGEQREAADPKADGPGGHE